MNKIILRIKGGLGNQLFSYCAARRLALVNNAELVIDTITGFLDDHQFCRKYSLDHFNIDARKATAKERLEPFARFRRKALKFISRRKSFKKRKFLEEEGSSFDIRFLELKVKGNLYIEGYFQSEEYFKDIENIIRNDLKIKAPDDIQNHKMAKKILSTNSVALHVRWFSKLNSSNTYKVELDYYDRAIHLIERKLNNPHYFVFSDDPSSAMRMIKLTSKRIKIVSFNRADERAYADLWLMTLCKHFIIANSTFSWWGAWLSESTNKIVICPDPLVDGSKKDWSAVFFEKQPLHWIKI